MAFVETLLPTAFDYTLVETGPKAGATSGSPVESSVTLFEHGGTEIGIWECSPGSWASRKDGFGELMHFVGGHGWITDTDGRWEIQAGAVKYFPDGWAGTWEVDETVRKVYVIIAT
jgi:uncharacterized cupin superfamily protein